MSNMPKCQIGLVANVWSKMMQFEKAGDIEFGHSHVLDHLTLLAKGRLQVTVDGVPSEFAAPQMIYIKAGKLHELVALEDDTIAYCIHALRDGDDAGDIIDPLSIPEGQTPYYKPMLTT